MPIVNFKVVVPRGGFRRFKKGDTVVIKGEIFMFTLNGCATFNQMMIDLAEDPTIWDVLHNDPRTEEIIMLRNCNISQVALLHPSLIMDIMGMGTVPLGTF